MVVAGWRCPNCGQYVAKPQSNAVLWIIIAVASAFGLYGAKAYSDEHARQRASDAAAVDRAARAEEERRRAEAEERRIAEMRRAQAQAEAQAEADQAARVAASKAAYAQQQAVIKQILDQQAAAMAQGQTWEPPPVAPAGTWTPPPVADPPPAFGTPYTPDMGKPVYVNGYTKSNGTYVQPHTRSAPHRR